MWQQLAAFTIVFTICWSLFRRKTTSHLPPGPTSLPIIGNILNLMLGKNPRKTFKDLAKTYGPVYGIYAGYQYVVLLSGIDEILEAFQRKATKTADRHRPWAIEYIQQGEPGIAFHDYDGFWRAQRKLVHHHMLSPAQINQFEPLILEEIDYLVKSIESEGNNSFNIGPLLRRTSLSIIATLIGGKHFESSDPNFLKLQESILFRTRSSVTPMDFFPLLKYLPLGWFVDIKEVDERTNFMKNFIGNMIEEHKKTFDSEISRDFIDVILQNRNKEEFQDEKSQPFIDENINNLFFGLFIAGSDTTATTLLWMILALCKNPSVQQKMQQEIDQVLKGKKATFEDKTQMKYVEAVIKEAMRWRPVTPFSLPHKNKESVEVGGITIPPGTIMFPNIWAVHMDETFWKNPEEFNPDRWFTGADSQDKHLIPFGVGIRECPGKHLAHRNIFLETVYMFQNFTFSTNPEVSTEGVQGLAYSPGEYKIIATKRKQS